MVLHYMLQLFLVMLAVPFEEDDKDPSIWFLDHNYHEAMFSMFRRINGMNLFIYLLCLGSLVYRYLFIKLSF